MDSKVRSLPPELGDLWAEIDLDAIAHNTTWVRGRMSPITKLAAVVKADAYGHGAAQVAQVMVDHGADSLAVTTVAEAEELRLSGIDVPILVMGSIRPEQCERVVELQLIPMVFASDVLRALSKSAARSGRAVSVHLKVDTGFGRYGVRPEEALDLMQDNGSLPGIQWEGIGTHLASAFRVGDPSNEKQYQRFLQVIEQLAAAGFVFPCKHIANSAAFVSDPKFEMDMIRAGNLLYGMEPFPGAVPSDALRSSWRLAARLTAVRDVPAGSYLGYGGDFRSRRPMTVGIVPIGFTDGWTLEPRSSSVRLRQVLKLWLHQVFGRLGIQPGFLRAPSGSVQIGKTICPLVGRVSMQQTMIDVTGIDSVAVGTEVFLHSRSTVISSRVPRVYYDTEGIRSIRVFNTPRRKQGGENS